MNSLELIAAGRETPEYLTLTFQLLFLSIAWFSVTNEKCMDELPIGAFKISNIPIVFLYN